MIDKTNIKVILGNHPVFIKRISNDKNYWVYYSLGVLKNNLPKKIAVLKIGVQNTKGRTLRTLGQIDFIRIPLLVFWTPIFRTEGRYFLGRLNCNIPKLFSFYSIYKIF